MNPISVEASMAAPGPAERIIVGSGAVGFTLRSMLIGMVLLGPELWAPPRASAQDPGRM